MNTYKVTAHITLGEPEFEDRTFTQRLKQVYPFLAERLPIQNNFDSVNITRNSGQKLAMTITSDQSQSVVKYTVKDFDANCDAMEVVGACIILKNIDVTKVTSHCPSNKILNPKTGKCVLKTGKIGKTIMGKKSRRKSRRKSRASYKLCKSHQYMDSKTKRCKNKSKSQKTRKSRRKSLVQCKAHQYRNPETNRCKNKKSGDKIRKSSKKSGGRKSCKSHKIRNPKTMRCVNKAGKIGLEIMRGAAGPNIPIPVVPGPGIPVEFKKIADDCAQNDVWEQKKLLGQGNYGASYEACRAGNCNYVLKTQKDDKDFHVEVDALSELQKTKVVPTLYAAWSCKGIGYLVIDKLQNCNIPKEEMYKQMKKILAKLLKAGWLHVDTHTGNVMCSGKKVIIIDFGWAVKRTSKGDKQLYTGHPLGGWMDDNKPLPWNFFKAAQDVNFESQFGKQGSPAYNKAMENWKKVSIKL
jgi:hypothetical protein